MSEKLPDLNAMRQQHETAPISKEQHIAELQESIERLENNPEGHILDKFMALSPEEQQEEVERVTRNRNLTPGSYTLEDRKKELADCDASFSAILVPLRLQTFKDELEKLLAENG